MTTGNQNTNNASPDQYAVKPYEPREIPLSPYLREIEYEEQEDFHLRDYIGVIVKRRWIIVSFLVAAVMLTAVFTAFMIPQYKSTVVIKIEKQAPAVLPGKEVLPVTDPNYVETQLEIIKSRSLAERVITKLALDKRGDFIPAESFFFAWLKKIKNSLKAGLDFLLRSGTWGKADMKNRAPHENIPDYLSNFLTDNIDIVPVKNSQLLKISFLSHDPELSMAVANTLADEYINYDLDSRVDASKEGKEFLAKQIDNARMKVETSEEKLNQYASQNEIIFLDNDKQSVLSKKLSEISSALGLETTERVRKEALYRQLRESGTNNPVILNDGLIQSLKKEHATLEAEYFNLSKTFTPDYPKMQNLKSQIDSLRDRIEREKRNIIKSVESDYHAAIKKENYLQSAVEGQKKQVLDFQERAVQYQTLKREVEVNKEMHNSLLQRYNEVGLAALNKSTNIQIVDRALFPKWPSKPDKVKNILLSLIFGLAGGIGLAFLLDYFDNSITDTSVIEKRLRLPSLGIVPFQPKLNLSSRPQIVSSEFTNPIAEAFRSISTFIKLSSSTNPPRTILVTSPGEKEGKTTVCINVASALAESLGRGLIIDADMRRPKLHFSFGVDNRMGLSTCLSGAVELEGSETKLIKTTSIKGLNVITSGPIPPNPSKLLHSARMRELLEALYEIYDFIIIDAPPLMGMPDSILLSSMVEGTILVVKAGETPRDAITAAKQIFSNVNGNLLGVVLNGLKRNDLKYGSYSHYFSSYFKT